jgi:protein-disulfide isomerase
MKELARWMIVAVALATAACGKKDESAAITPPAASPSAASAAGGATTDWTAQVVATADGGFRMGNPDAPVKLIEYGSLTCPHCADFSENGVPLLKSSYVATGKVSYEFRNFIRDGFDLTAALLARCGGAEPFFKLTEQLYAAQPDWIGKIQALPAAEQQRIQSLPPDQQGPAVAQAAGLDAFMKQRGFGWEKARACILDKQAQDKLLAMRQTAVSQFNLEGTPTFIVNGKAIEGPNWQALEPALKAAGA